MADACRRRDLFQGLLRSLARAVPEPAPTSRPAPARIPPPRRPALPPIPIRPPGAAPEARLLELCTRCDACEEACPHDVLVRLGPAYGKAEGTPGFFPEAFACRLCADLACARACPTGALRAPPSLAMVRMGTAKVQADRCLIGQGTPCDDCAQACPSTVMAIRIGTAAPRILEDRCTGCGLCVEACPATPKALRVLPAP